MTLRELIDRYVAFRRALGELQGSNASTLRAFGRAMGEDTAAAAVRVERVEAFLAGTGPVTLTWHIKLSALRAFYRYAVSRGHVPAAPLPTVVRMALTSLECLSARLVWPRAVVS